MKNPYELAKNILKSAADGTDQDRPSGRFTSIDLYGAAVHERGMEAVSCSTFHLENESGTGDITLYHVFSGIELVYNDMHMEYCNKNQEPASDVMEINYCKEGRSECLFGEHQYYYMAAGDLSFCSLQENSHQSEFPTSHYHGITIDFSRITDEMRNVLELLAVDLKRIRELAKIREFTMIRADQRIEHIFSELYTVPKKIRHGYIRVKVLELLLVLTELDPKGENPVSKPYFSQSQIEAVKQIHGFLLEHFKEHCTKSLARRLALST